MGIQVHNGIKPEIKDFSHNIKIFKSSLRVSTTTSILYIG
jgi:hypothetical protein